MEEKEGAQSKKSSKWVIISIIGTVLVLFLILTLHSTSFAQLDAKVQDGDQGIYVTNLESMDWTDCMVGVNGSDGFNFTNPPYQTRTALTLPAGQTTFVSFGTLSAEDGTLFDPATHSVNGSVVVCFRSGTERTWSGSH